MRQSPAGIYIYSDTGTIEVLLTETRGAYAPELDELYDALVYGKPVLHSVPLGSRDTGGLPGDHAVGDRTQGYPDAAPGCRS